MRGGIFGLSQAEKAAAAKAKAEAEAEAAKAAKSAKIKKDQQEALDNQKNRENEAAIKTQNEIEQDIKLSLKGDLDAIERIKKRAAKDAAEITRAEDSLLTHAKTGKQTVVDTMMTKQEIIDNTSRYIPGTPP